LEAAQQIRPPGASASTKKEKKKKKKSYTRLVEQTQKRDGLF
jgi:hypothetical protein